MITSFLAAGNGDHENPAAVEADELDAFLPTTASSDRTTVAALTTGMVELNARQSSTGTGGSVTVDSQVRGSGGGTGMPPLLSVPISSNASSSGVLAVESPSTPYGMLAVSAQQKPAPAADTLSKRREVAHFEVPPAASDEVLAPPQKDLGDVVLRLRGIEKSFVIENSDEPVSALRGVNLFADSTSSGSRVPFSAVRRGEFLMIRGPSGGGKTTLLNIIGTLDAPTKGSVELLGHMIDGKSDDGELADIRLQHLGFVFQTFNLISTMTAVENVELPMTLLGRLSAKDARTRAKQLLGLVGLRNRNDHLPSELSGGEQQRVTIARSLANNPSILLLDEPTGDLDTATTIDVMNLLMRLNHLTKTTCIMVTHNPDLECYADRILYVADGAFHREVINQEPRMLDLELYQKYLDERDRQMATSVLRRDV